MKKEMTPNRKIPVKILVGIAVYIVSYLLSIAILYSLSGFFHYSNTFIGSMSSLVAAVASGAVLRIELVPASKTEPAVAPAGAEPNVHEGST